MKYFDEEYSSVQRFASFAEQIALMQKIKAKNILEIGVGNGIFRFIMRSQNCTVTSMDIDANLKPDVNASILEPFPFPDNSFDATVAFEVFEHVPLKHLSFILVELKRVSKTYIVFSVPTREWFFRFNFATNYFNWMPLITIPRIFKRLNQTFEYKNDQHYWHIGDKGVRISEIRKMIKETEVSLICDFRSKHNPGHHFFLIKKQQ